MESWGDDDKASFVYAESLGSLFRLILLTHASRNNLPAWSPSEIVTISQKPAAAVGTAAAAATGVAAAAAGVAAAGAAAVRMSWDEICSAALEQRNDHVTKVVFACKSFSESHDDDEERQAFYKAVAEKTVTVRLAGGKLVGVGPGSLLEDFSERLDATG